MEIPARKGLYSIVLAGYLGLVGCGGGGSVSKPPPQPSLSQAISLVNDVDIHYAATLQNVAQATRTITHNGTQIGTTTITYSPYAETLNDREKGDYKFDLTAGNLSDTDSLTIPNYDPTSNFSSLETNLDERYGGSSKTFNLESLLSDKNPEDRPVPLVDSRSLDGKTSVSIDGYNLTITAIGAPGSYQVGVNFGSDVGGHGSGVIAGEIREVPEQIAFASWVNGNEDIYLGYLVEGILTNIRRLTEHPRQDLEPAWSPDGNQIAFTSTRDGNVRIYVRDMNTGDIRTLTLNVDYAKGAAWSPDGSKIAFAYLDFVSSFKGIGLINPDGNGFTRLVEKPFDGTGSNGISWSPDGLKLFYSTYENGNWDIYVVNSDGTRLPERITDDLKRDLDPDLSPDGLKIIFESDRIGEELDIDKMDSNGGNVQRLTTDPAREGTPAWSRDGTKIVFSRWNPIISSFQMYLMNPDGTGETPLSVDGLYPTWRPY